MDLNFKFVGFFFLIEENYKLCLSNPSGFVRFKMVAFGFIEILISSIFFLPLSASETKILFRSLRFCLDL